MILQDLLDTELFVKTNRIEIVLSEESESEISDTWWIDANEKFDEFLVVETENDQYLFDTNVAVKIDGKSIELKNNKNIICRMNLISFVYLYPEKFVNKK